MKTPSRVATFGKLTFGRGWGLALEFGHSSQTIPRADSCVCVAGTPCRVWRSLAAQLLLAPIATFSTVEINRH
jgi:hypothetical protein